MNEKRIYSGPIFDLVQKNIQIHNKTYSRDIIQHPGGVGLLVMKEDQILLVKQYRPAIESYTWEIPAGKLEKGEDPKTCGLRELNEETGYECHSCHLKLKMVSTPGFCDEIIYIFEAKEVYCAKDRLPMDEDEDIEIKWFDLDQAMSMITQNEIIDAKTLIAIQQAWIDRKKEKR